VIEKCGGAAIVAEIAGVHVSRVYRWTHAKSKGGSAGIIPARHHQKILDGARERGLDLSPSDFFEGEA